MAQFFNDLFVTGATADVTTHTSDSGHSWVLAKGVVTPKVFSASSGVIGNGGSSTTYSFIRPSVISPVADAKTTAQFHYDSVSFTSMGLCVRMAADGSAGYAATYLPATKKWTLFRLALDAAQTVEVAASAVINYTAGTEDDLVLSAEGTGATVTVKLSLDGVDIITYSDTAGNRVTAAGYPGLCFQVAAAAGSGAWFNSMSADTLAAAPADTTAPTMTGTLASSGVTSSAYTLDWSGTTRADNVAITGYETSPDGVTWTDVGNVTSRAFAGLTPSTAYPNYVRAYDAAANKSTPPLQLTVTTAAPSSDTTLPVLAGSITAGTITSSTIPFSWPAGSDNVAVTGYEVSKDGGTTWVDAGNVLTYTFTGLAASTAFGIRVRAYDAAGLKSTPALTASLSTLAGSAQTYPSRRNMAFGDRVDDTTTTEGTGTITLSNASARTFASAYAVGTKRIPYCIQNDSGSIWEAGLGTLLTATTLSRDEVLGSYNAGAPVAFGAGTKRVFCTVPAQAFATFAVKDYIDIRDFDVDPTFTNDSQVGIQAAIVAAHTRNISRIKFPDGRFKLAGARTTGNAHLYIPNTRSTDPSRTILFEGVSPPNFEMQGLVSMPVTTNGTILESTVVGNTGSALLRGEVGWSGEPANFRWNYTNVGFRNMGFRTKADSGANPMTAIDLAPHAQIIEFDNIRVDVNTPIISCPDPSAVNSSGIILPPVNNHAQLNIGNVLVAGFTNGITIGEHTHAKSITALGCVNGLVVPYGAHGSCIQHLLVECSKNSIHYSGNHALSILGYSTEHNNDGNWFDFARDIYSTASGYSRKIVILQSTVVVSRVGITDSAFSTNDAACYKVFIGAGAN